MNRITDYYNQKHDRSGRFASGGGGGGSAALAAAKKGAVKAKPSPAKVPSPPASAKAPSPPAPKKGAWRKKAYQIGAIVGGVGLGVGAAALGIKFMNKHKLLAAAGGAAVGLKYRKQLGELAGKAADAARRGKKKILGSATKDKIEEIKDKVRLGREAARYYVRKTKRNIRKTGRRLASKTKSSKIPSPGFGTVPSTHEEDLQANFSDSEIQEWLESASDQDVADVRDFFENLNEQDRGEFVAELEPVMNNQDEKKEEKKNLTDIEYAMNRWGFSANEEGVFCKEIEDTDEGHYVEVDPQDNWVYVYRGGDETREAKGSGYEALKETLSMTEASRLTDLRHAAAMGGGAVWAGYSDADQDEIQFNEDEVTTIVNRLDVLTDAEIEKIGKEAKSPREAAENLGKAISEKEKLVGASSLLVDNAELEVDLDEDLDFDEDDEIDDEELAELEGIDLNDDAEIDLGDEVDEVEDNAEENPSTLSDQKSEISSNVVHNNNGDGGITTMAENKKPCCPGKVEVLIQSKHSPYKEIDREWLLGLDEPQINRLVETDALLVQAAQKEEGAMTVNELKQIMSNPDQFMNLLPPEMAEQFRSGMQLHRDKRQKLIGALIQANSKFTEDSLKGRTMEALEELVSLIPSKVDYSVNGAGAPAVHSTVPTEILPPPGVKVN